MSDSVRPHRWKPTRRPCPWDSPGKNTGVGCHFLLQCMKVKSESEVASRVQLLATPWTTAYQAPPSMGFSRQEYWSGVPLPSPGLSLWLRNKESACNAVATRNVSSIPGFRRSPGGGHSIPLQYSSLENPMGRESWRAIVHKVTKSWT